MILRLVDDTSSSFIARLHRIRMVLLGGWPCQPAHEINSNSVSGPALIGYSHDNCAFWVRPHAYGGHRTDRRRPPPRRVDSYALENNISWLLGASDGPWHGSSGSDTTRQTDILSEFHLVGLWIKRRTVHAGSEAPGQIKRQFGSGRIEASHHDATRFVVEPGASQNFGQQTAERTFRIGISCNEQAEPCRCHHCFVARYE